MFPLQVSYLLEGNFRHEDFVGHEGVLGPGDLQVSFYFEAQVEKCVPFANKLFSCNSFSNLYFQWMTAGRGIVHSEMPFGDKPCRGLQLWVNLAKQFKMIEPQYQELKDKEIPRKRADGVEVKVIAGTSMGTTVSFDRTDQFRFILKKNSLQEN